MKEMGGGVLGSIFARYVLLHLKAFRILCPYCNVSREDCTSLVFSAECTIVMV